MQENVGMFPGVKVMEVSRSRAQMTLLELNSRDTSFTEPSGQDTITNVGTNKFIKRYCLTASEKHEARLSMK